MENYTHHFELRTNILHFMAAMDGAVVKRYNSTTNLPEQEVKVNYVYAPKSAIIKDLTTKTNTIQFPIVAISMKSFRRSADRVKNKLDGYYQKMSLSDINYTKIRSPIPVDITFELHAMSVFQRDLEQIITNWAAYFDPYIVVSWKEPYTGYDLRSKIVWAGDGNISYPDQSKGEVPYRLELTASFTFEGWLFKADPEEIGRICYIDTEWSVLSSQFCVMGDEVSWDSETENFHISGIPNIQRVEPFILTSNKIWNMYLLGNFDNIRAVFVSSNNSEMFPLSSFDYFPENEDFPYFDGYPINQFQHSENFISFDIEPLTSGRMDIVVVNDCGYSLLTETITSNPYPEEHPFHVSWNDMMDNGINVIEIFPLSCN